MRAELIDYMGSDLTVVNAARVSFDKESKWDSGPFPTGSKEWVEPSKVLSEKDIRLLTYLAKHNHWTPFSHVQITMRETVPIFVARQRFKHMVGFTYNEISRRYVDDEPEIFVPDLWRKRAENKKQGSLDEGIELQANAKYIYEAHCRDALNVYNELLEDGVAPEQARMVLPQSMYTSYYVTGSLAAWARAYKLRSEESSQKEIQDLATQWNTIIGGLSELKYSWEALTDATKEG